MIRKFSVLFALVYLTGCAPSPEELDRLTKEDPNFRQMILSRDQIYSQIKLIKGDLLTKKEGLDSQVNKLRQDYDTYAKVQNAKIEKYQKTIDGYRSSLRKNIDTGGARLAAKQKELEGYQKTLNDVKKVLHESKTMNLSAQEKEKWEERMLILSEKIRPLTDDIQELRAQINLKKRKNY